MTELKSAGKHSISWLTMTIVLTNVGMVAIVVWSVAQFGSIGEALEYANGHRLFVDAKSKSFGNVENARDRNVKFKIVNKSEIPITIVGAKTSCACVATDDVPVTIPQMGERLLSIRFRTSTETGPISETIRFYTDYPNQPELVLNIKGFVYSHR